jgi:hypothetical protein
MKRRKTQRLPMPYYVLRQPPANLCSSPSQYVAPGLKSDEVNMKCAFITRRRRARNAIAGIVRPAVTPLIEINVKYLDQSR